MVNFSRTKPWTIYPELSVVLCAYWSSLSPLRANLCSSAVPKEEAALHWFRPSFTLTRDHVHRIWFASVQGANSDERTRATAAAFNARTALAPRRTHSHAKVATRRRRRICFGVQGDLSGRFLGFVDIKSCVTV